MNDESRSDAEVIRDAKASGYVVGYVVRAIRRRRRLFGLLAGLLTGMVALGGVLAPRTYQVKTRLMTQANLLMVNLVNPDKPLSSAMPTASAPEMLKSRAHLQTVLDDAKLIEKQEAKRGSVGRAWHRAFEKVFGMPDKVQTNNGYLKLLDDRLSAEIEDSVISMTVVWPDPDIALSLAQENLARFLKLRHDTELGELTESVEILNQRMLASQEQIAKTVALMQQAVQKKERENQAQAPAVPTPKHAHVLTVERPSPGLDPQQQALRSDLLRKQEDVTRVKRAYEARVKAAEEKLANLRSSLGPEHPDVLDARKERDETARPPAELLGAQTAQEALAKQLTSTGVAPAPVTVRRDDDRSSEDASYRLKMSEDVYKKLDTDPELKAMMDEVKRRQTMHYDVVKNLMRARLEKDIAGAAFESRYVVTLPPVLPREPSKPVLPLIAAAELAALFLAVLVCTAVDALSGRINEAWQIERFLNLRFLGEIER